MFSVSFPEIFMLMLVILIVFGPERLPEMAKNLGQFMGKLRSHTDGMRKEFYNAVYTPAKDIKKELNSLKTELQTLPDERAKKRDVVSTVAWESEQDDEAVVDDEAEGKSKDQK